MSVDFAKYDKKHGLVLHDETYENGMYFYIGKSDLKAKNQRTNSKVKITSNVSEQNLRINMKISSILRVRITESKDHYIISILYQLTFKIIKFLEFSEFGITGS